MSYLVHLFPALALQCEPERRRTEPLRFRPSTIGHSATTELRFGRTCSADTGNNALMGMEPAEVTSRGRQQLCRDVCLPPMDAETKKPVAQLTTHSAKAMSRKL